MNCNFWIPCGDINKLAQENTTQQNNQATTKSIIKPSTPISSDIQQDIQAITEPTDEANIAITFGSFDHPGANAPTRENAAIEQRDTNDEYNGDWSIYRRKRNANKRINPSSRKAMTNSSSPPSSSGSSTGSPPSKVPKVTPKAFNSPPRNRTLGDFLPKEILDPASKINPSKTPSSTTTSPINNSISPLTTMETTTEEAQLTTTNPNYLNPTLHGAQPLKPAAEGVQLVFNESPSQKVLKCNDCYIQHPRNGYITFKGFRYPSHLFYVYGEPLAQESSSKGTYMVIHKGQTSALVRNVKKEYSLTHSYTHIRKFTMGKAEDNGPNRFYNSPSLPGAQIGLLITSYKDIPRPALKAFCEIVGYHGPPPRDDEPLADWERKNLLKLDRSNTPFRPPLFETTLLSLELHTVYLHQTKTPASKQRTTSTPKSGNETHSPRLHSDSRIPPTTSTSNANPDQNQPDHQPTNNHLLPKIPPKPQTKKSSNGTSLQSTSQTTITSNLENNPSSPSTTNHVTNTESMKKAEEQTQRTMTTTNRAANTESMKKDIQVQKLSKEFKKMADSIYDLPERLNYISEQERHQMQNKIFEKLEDIETSVEKKISVVKNQLDTKHNAEDKMAQKLTMVIHNLAADFSKFKTQSEAMHKDGDEKTQLLIEMVRDSASAFSKVSTKNTTISEEITTLALAVQALDKSYHNLNSNYQNLSDNNEKTIKYNISLQSKVEELTTLTKSLRAENENLMTRVASLEYYDLEKRITSPSSPVTYPNALTNANNPNDNPSDIHLTNNISGSCNPPISGVGTLGSEIISPVYNNDDDELDFSEDNTQDADTHDEGDITIPSPPNSNPNTINTNILNDNPSNIHPTNNDTTIPPPPNTNPNAIINTNNLNDNPSDIHPTNNNLNDNPSDIHPTNNSSGSLNSSILSVRILGSEMNSSEYADENDDEPDFSDEDTQSTVIQSDDSSPMKDPPPIVDSLVTALSNNSDIPSPDIHPTTDYDSLSYNELQKLAAKRKLNTTKSTTVSLRALLSADDRKLFTNSTN